MGVLQSSKTKIVGGFLGAVILVICMGMGIVFGTTHISLQTVIDSFTHFNGSQEHLFIKEIRLPRMIIGTVVGICLGIAGVLLQALTRNPLADLGIFGLHAGASFFIACAVFFFSISSLTSFIWIAFLGATISGLIVFIIGKWGGEEVSSLYLTLAGASMAALFSSATHAIFVINQRALEEVLVWITGSLADRKLSMLMDVLPYMIVACLIAFLISNKIDTLLLGEKVAMGLGQRTVWLKIVMVFLVILLSASTVSIAGPISFVGLVAPHFARYFVGNTTRWTLLYSGMIGAILLLIADILARVVTDQFELPVGIVMAMMAAPFFILLARKEG
ncbi:FecCD family ABC transporter permease [Thermoflavimicrobium daqui]|jgi:iron complex transport system permease protein|uniref:Iron ABC transporter n=1 Tax=Thermoflavimicrobium daqui TaxID=2137476 RepID=A0A364K0S5_9BACL|nr:iron ABC transporter permease [Thermoflavimicrobium daqui]RAL21107.1 iron ABC transporter [Thermoflavimicrobium daqui]